MNTFKVPLMLTVAVDLTTAHKQLAVLLFAGERYLGPTKRNDGLHMGGSGDYGASFSGAGQLFNKITKHAKRKRPDVSNENQGNFQCGQKIIKIAKKNRGTFLVLCILAMLTVFGTGLLDYVGFSECWSVGLLECWIIGVLDCWSVEF